MKGLRQVWRVGVASRREIASSKKLFHYDEGLISPALLTCSLLVYIFLWRAIAFEHDLPDLKVKIEKILQFLKHES